MKQYFEAWRQDVRNGCANNQDWLAHHLGRIDTTERIVNMLMDGLRKARFLIRNHNLKFHVFAQGWAIDYRLLASDPDWDDTDSLERYLGMLVLYTVVNDLSASTDANTADRLDDFKLDMVWVNGADEDTEIDPVQSEMLVLIDDVGTALAQCVNQDTVTKVLKLMQEEIADPRHKTALARAIEFAG